jgi:hypothetical protein
MVLWLSSQVLQGQEPIQELVVQLWSQSCAVSCFPIVNCHQSQPVSFHVARKGSATYGTSINMSRWNTTAPGETPNALFAAQRSE